MVTRLKLDATDAPIEVEVYVGNFCLVLDIGKLGKRWRADLVHWRVANDGPLRGSQYNGFTVWSKSIEGDGSLSQNKNIDSEGGQTSE